jgi:putative ABC transport system permease protein
MGGGLVARLRSLWRGVHRRADVEQDMTDEFRHHLELRAADLVRSGLSTAEAHRRARLEFGSVERYKDEGRRSRGLRRIDDLRVSWLDLKLGARMLVKYPALSIIGGLGMAVAMAIGAGVFGIMETSTNPTLPLDDGDRVVVLENFDVAAREADRRLLHDFVEWRTGLRSVRDLGAYRAVGRNLIADGGRAQRIAVAEMTASGFRVARVAPLLGRYLDDGDERIGAADVVVIGYDLWQSRFGGDRDVVGRTLQLGATRSTIVGVMPKGFAFPVNYTLWAPLRLDASAYPRGKSPDLTVFGRLVPGATLEQARAELAIVGRRTAAAHPGIYDRIQPQVLPYAHHIHPFFQMDGPGSVIVAHIVQLVVSLLLVVICVNVAVLVYARTATCQGEIAVRTALGASRRRIIAQLFGEALVLSAASAAVGLSIAAYLLRQATTLLDRVTGGLPFWFQLRVSPATVLYTAALTVLGAVIIGVVPAVKATGRRLTFALRQIGGGASPRLGRTWTVLIVAQVAITVAVLPAAITFSWKTARLAVAGPGFAANTLLTASLSMDAEMPPSAETAADQPQSAPRFAERQEELMRRIEAEPDVAAVTFAQSFPGDESTVWVDIDGIAPPSDTTTDEPVAAGSSTGHQVRFGRVGAGFFEAFQATIVAGRAFRTGDAGAGATAAMVNQTFVARVLGGGSALGRRFRYVGRARDTAGDAVELGRWYEIVGVVADLPLRGIESGNAEVRVYQAAAPGAMHPVSLFVRMRGVAPSSFAGRLDEIATALDPTLTLRRPLPLDEVYRQHQAPLRIAAAALAVVTLSAMLLSAAGIYALMSVIVTRRRREIGIRIALGADRRRILGSVFSRAVAQLGVGVGIGIATAILLNRLSDGGVMGDAAAGVILPLVSLIMLVVGLLATLGPARRGLSIEPTEALRADA